MPTEERSAIRSHHTGTTDETWSAANNERRVRKDESSAYYARVYAWKDPDGEVGNKSTYKFIHHVVGEDGAPGDASTRACSNGIGVLNGGRGGADIPDDDRRGVYNHLAMHLRDADRDVPELKSAPEEDLERRFVPLAGSELRAEMAEDKPMVVGYAAKFNVWDGDEEMFMERIQKGAFSRTVLKDDIRCLFNHDPNKILGRKSNKTLRLWEDNYGLYMECDINTDDQEAMSVFSKVKRGDVSGQSFSFYHPRDIWDFSDEKTPKRTLVEVDVVDVGPVTFPFYEVTSAEPAYRSLTRARERIVVVNDDSGRIAREIRLMEKRRHDFAIHNLKQGAGK